MTDHPGATLTDGCWLTLSEAAIALGVSVHSVRRKVRAGQLVARRVPTDRGPAWRVRLHPDGQGDGEGGQGDAHPGATVTAAGTPGDPVVDALEHGRADATVASGSRQADATVAEGAGVVELVRLVRDLQTEVVARTEAATAWQARAEMLAVQLDQVREQVRALQAPAATEGPERDVAGHRGANPAQRVQDDHPASWRRRWRWAPHIVAVLVALAIVATLAAPEWIR